MLCFFVGLFCQNNNNSGYPSALEIFIGKHMLFKVEITDGNLKHNWRNYTVKRTSNDPDLIKKFVDLHKIKVAMRLLPIQYSDFFSSSLVNN